MATVSDGTNPGRSATPQRQSPGTARSGHGAGGDPTNQVGQTPSEIFGFHQSYSTGAPGSQGASGTEPDVTLQHGQLEDGLSGLSRDQVTSTGAPGSQGGSPQAGGESVRYTDPFGYLGNVHRDVTAPNAIGGPSDSTKAIDGYSPGPSLPGLEGNRPTSTGAGSGHTSVKHPNAGA